jgi:hypothetical protein
MIGPLRLGILLAQSSLIVATGSSAQGILRGRVVADSNQSPLAGAEVILNPSGRSVIVSASGTFEIGPLPSGKYRVLARRIGYEPSEFKVTISKSDTVEVLVRLRNGPQQLEPVAVSAEGPFISPAIRGLLDRRERGIGKFLTPEELRAQEPRALADILRQWGVAVRRDRNGVLHAINPRGVTSFQSAECRMQIYLDGMPLIMKPPADDLRNYALQSLDGVELYTGISETPVQFERADASCGVLVLWTRRR